MPGLVKVTVAPTATRLTTVTAAQAECDTAADVSALIDRASAVIATHCGRAFGLQTIAETFRLERHQYRRHRRIAPLLLQYGPVEIASVTEDGTALTVDTDYEADGSLLHRLCGNFRTEWHCSPIVATYTTGWVLPEQDDPTLPADVESACLALVRGAFNYIGSDPSVSRDMTEGVGLVNYFARSASGLVLDAGLTDQLFRYVVMVR